MIREMLTIAAVAFLCIRAAASPVTFESPCGNVVTLTANIAGQYDFQLFFMPR
jgi:hypothetical protein